MRNRINKKKHDHHAYCMLYYNQQNQAIVQKYLYLDISVAQKCRRYHVMPHFEIGEW
jgi:hypothetical protein